MKGFVDVAKLAAEEEKEREAEASEPRPIPGGDKWTATMLQVKGDLPTKTIVVGDQRKSKWAHVQRELVDVGIGSGEAGGRLSATQKEILSMGKAAWVRKTEGERVIRKMSGAIAIAMSLVTTYLMSEVYTIVDQSETKPPIVRLLVLVTGVWAILVLAFLLRQCVRSARKDTMLDKAKAALDAKQKRDRALERGELPSPSKGRHRSE